MEEDDELKNIQNDLIAALVELQTFLTHCKKKKKKKKTLTIGTEIVGKQQKPQQSERWCLKEKREEIKRKRSEVRCTEARGFSEWEHNVTLRSLRHTGFDTPHSFILISTWSPGNRRECTRTTASFCSTNCNKNCTVWVANSEWQKSCRDPRWPA